MDEVVTDTTGHVVVLTGLLEVDELIGELPFPGWPDGSVRVRCSWTRSWTPTARTADVVRATTAGHALVVPCRRIRARVDDP
jgi:hypothetical protein